MKLVVNAEGMTWEEWAYAAGVQPEPILSVPLYGHNYPLDPLREKRAAWRIGEDPSEYRTGAAQ